MVQSDFYSTFMPKMPFGLLKWPVLGCKTARFRLQNGLFRNALKIKRFPCGTDGMFKACQYGQKKRDPQAPKLHETAIW